jgi:CRP-like cAMP-binding protein
VRLHQCKPVLDTLQVVHVGGDPGLPGGIAQALQHMCFVEGDYVMRQGTKPDGMFFVQTGTVEIVKNKDGFETRVTTLSDGSFFGENALISDSGRATASVRAITNVNGLYLSKRNYTHLTANYPAFKKYLETVANLREKARQDEKKPRSLGKKQPVKKPETLPDTMAIRMQAAWKAQRTRKEIAEMRQGQGNPSAILLTAARTLTEKKLVKGGTSTIDDVEASSNGSPTPARSNPGSPSTGGAGSRRISWKDGGPDGGVGAGGSPFSAVGKRSGAGA